MAIAIDEARIRPTFAEPWRALKWDAEATDPPPRPSRDGVECRQGDLDGRAVDERDATAR